MWLLEQLELSMDIQFFLSSCFTEENTAWSRIKPLSSLVLSTGQEFKLTFPCHVSKKSTTEVKLQAKETVFHTIECLDNVPLYVHLRLCFYISCFLVS